MGCLGGKSGDRDNSYRVISGFDPVRIGLAALSR